MSREPGFQNLPLLHVQEVLDEIAKGSAEASPSGQGPILTLVLHSGATITGQVLSVGNGSDARRPLILRRCDPPHGPEDALVYLDARSIDVVTVHAASKVVDLLSRGQIDRLPVEVPGRLALQRRATEIGEHVSPRIGSPLPMTVVWDGLPDSPYARWSLSLVLDSFQQALEDIAGSPEGVEALGQLEEIRIEHGLQRRVYREGSVLVLCCVFDAGDRGRLTGNALVRALETNL